MIDETGEAIDARARLVAWAEGEIGEQDPRKYYRVCAPQFANDPKAVHGVSWCGIFCLAGLHVIAPTRAPMWVTGKGFVFRLLRTKTPEPGDVAVFGPPLWHHAIVERVEFGQVFTIDGNVLLAPREGVARRVRPANTATFYSIAPLLCDVPAL